MSIGNNISYIDYTYDSAGQVLVEGTQIAGSGTYPNARKEVKYCRYPNGDVSRITYPDGSTVVGRNYTARGQLEGVGWGPRSMSYAYFPDGRVNYQAYTGGMYTKFEYNGRGMISSIRHKKYDALHDLAFREYWRDDRDRITAWKRGVDSTYNGMEDGRGDRYRYDSEGQLEQADYRALNPESDTPGTPKRRDRFDYDELGNRMGSNELATRGTVNFTRDDNGLNQYRTWYSATNYDDDVGGQWGSPGAANGVLMQEGYITASFNALNQPMAIWSPAYPNGPSAQYMWFGFDPLGRCVKRWVSPLVDNHAPPVNTNPATYYYYDGWNLVQEGPNAATADRIYVHGSRVDEIVASRVGGQWYYHHYDARGHCIMLTNAATAELVEQYDYDAFGNPYFHTASGSRLVFQNVHTRFLFTGREYLPELRLYDFRHRMYQPELGRFLQPDPIQFKAGDYNLYRYCHNDPVNKTDPDGQIVPILLGIWAVYEIGSTIYDAYNAAETFSDPNASTSDKIIAGGGLIASAALPGGGYGTGGKALANAAKKPLEGAGKTGRKINADRQAVAKAKIADLKQQLKTATTKAEKKEIKDAMKHERTKLGKSPEHARRAQGH